MHTDILTRTLLWFQKAVAKPVSKNLHAQLGVHMEEVNEMLMEVSPKDFVTEGLLDAARASIAALSDHLKSHDDVVMIKPENRVGYLDALCDQIVTATGCAHMANLDIIGGMTEVNGSNFSKFNDRGEPIFNENMKIMKGPNYFKADLASFV